MITASPLPAQQPRPWQRLWREAIDDPRELLRMLDLSHLAGELLPRSDTGFAMRVPRGFAARMRTGDPHDPLLAQVLPRGAELAHVPGFVRDAVGELGEAATMGVLRKYSGRALLVTTGACAVNCRYCFRRHFPYAQHVATANHWHEALARIRADTGIVEVILSGGDPLSLSTAKLAQLTDALADIAHVQRLRIHTRLPVVLPERVDEEFIAWLARLPWPVVIVLHANHANELDDSVACAGAALRRHCAALLNQSVLLRGVNDSVQVLKALSERLLACGVTPYYLHQLDPVAGAAHFDVPDERARVLIDALRAELPGYLVPRLVREIAGATGKAPL